MGLGTKGRAACPRGPAAPGGNLPAQGRHRGNIPARRPSPYHPPPRQKTSGRDRPHRPQRPPQKLYHCGPTACRRPEGGRCCGPSPARYRRNRPHQALEIQCRDRCGRCGHKWRPPFWCSGIARVGRQNRRRKADALRPFIDTVTHARTARAKPDRCRHANYREDVGRKLAACALGATRMRCRVPRALALCPAISQAEGAHTYSPRPGPECRRVATKARSCTLASTRRKISVRDQKRI